VSRQEREGFCTLCRSRCGTINVVENGRLVEVRNNPRHPTGKATCAKGRAAPEIAHSARRLTQPLRRTAPKGAHDPGFVPISWDEAMTEIAARLNAIKAESGPEAVAFAVTSGSSSSTSDSLDWIQRLIRSFGSPNTVFSTEICNWHKDFAHAFTFGCGLPTADYRNSDLILLWGHNPSNVWLAQSEAISAARIRGAKLVVIDPRQTDSARDAELWLRVRPGTDGALAMGLSRQLIKAHGYNEHFVRNYTNACFLVREDDGLFLRGRDLGWDDEPDSYVVLKRGTRMPVPARADLDHDKIVLSASVKVATVKGDRRCRTAFRIFQEAVEPFDLDRVADVTGIPQVQVEALAKAISEAGSISYHCWTGVGQHTNASQTERAIATLYALTDSFDKPGGNVRHATQPVPKLHSMDMMPPETRAKALGLSERPVGPPMEGWVTNTDFYTAVLERKPYAVRGLFVFGSNLLVSQPGSERGRAALEALEFLVHCDLFMNPTSQYADIILPVASPWENEALRIGFEISHEAQELVQLRQRVVPRTTAARSDVEIVFELGKRLGLAFFDGNVDAGYNYLLEPLGLTVDDLRAQPGGIRVPLQKEFQKYRRIGFPTQTGRAELYSELLLRNGYPAVPHYVPPFDARDDDFPLILFSVNNGYFCHSQHRGTNSLRKRRPDPLASLHPSIARRLGIAPNDWFLIRTRRGAVRVRAVLDDNIASDTVASDYGWWQPAPDLGLSGIGTIAQDNHVTTFNNIMEENARDPLSGSLPLRSSRCRVEALSAQTWTGARPFMVTSKRLVSQDVTALTLKSLDAAPVPGFRPGQFIGVKLEGQQRSYSLTSAATEAVRSYSIAVRRVDEGVVSNAIADRLDVGNVVDLCAPSGNFLIPLRSEFPVVMIAGGIGITPFISYLASLHGSAEEPPRVVLHYGCRDADNIPFGKELAGFVKTNPRLLIVTHLSRGAPANSGFIDGRFRVKDIAQALIDARARFYICAAGEMIETVTQELIARGVPKFEIFSERFRSPEGALALDLSPRDVIFARSQRTLRWTSESGSILNLAESAGLTISSGCRVGQCESCAVRVLEGTVVHATEPQYLEEGQCLTCQARPATDVLLDA
jgi:anaerobic selenocysteine-containing dehydrogenase/ferredoxin-NADP reductase